jgi:hypothetical protein
MKVAIKAMLLAAAACSCSTQAFASYTISGTIPAGGAVVIHLRKPLPASIIMTLSVTRVNAHTPYAVDFCIGPAANPCGLPTDLVVTVPAGQTSPYIFIDNPSILRHQIITVGQGTKVPVPYSVKVY